MPAMLLRDNFSALSFILDIKFMHKVEHELLVQQATIAQSTIVAFGVSLSNAAQRIRRHTGHWKPRLLCGVSKRNPCWHGWRPVVTGC